MTITMFVIFLALFFGAQYVVEKEKIPKKFVQLSVGKQLISALAILILAVVIGVVTHLTLVPIGVTILLASIISARFRKGFNQMEKGGKL